MGKNKALAHHTSTYFHTRGVIFFMFSSIYMYTHRTYQRGIVEVLVGY